MPTRPCALPLLDGLRLRCSTLAFRRAQPLVTPAGTPKWLRDFFAGGVASSASAARHFFAIATSSESARHSSSRSKAAVRFAAALRIVSSIGLASKWSFAREDHREDAAERTRRRGHRPNHPVPVPGTCRRVCLSPALRRFPTSRFVRRSSSLPQQLPISGDSCG